MRRRLGERLAHLFTVPTGTVLLLTTMRGPSAWPDLAPPCQHVREIGRSVFVRKVPTAIKMTRDECTVSRASVVNVNRSFSRLRSSISSSPVHRSESGRLSSAMQSSSIADHHVVAHFRKARPGHEPHIARSEHAYPASTHPSMLSVIRSMIPVVDLPATRSIRATRPPYDSTRSPSHCPLEVVIAPRQDVGPNLLDEVDRRVLFEEHDVVHAAQAGQESRRAPLRRGSDVLPLRRLTEASVLRPDQTIPELARGFQVLDVSRVQRSKQPFVKTTVSPRAPLRRRQRARGIVRFRAAAGPSISSSISSRVTVAVPPCRTLMPAATFAIRAAVSGLSPEQERGERGRECISGAGHVEDLACARGDVPRGASAVQAHAALGPREDQRREPEPLEQPFGAGVVPLAPEQIRQLTLVRKQEVGGAVKLCAYAFRSTTTGASPSVRLRRSTPASVTVPLR